MIVNSLRSIFKRTKTLSLTSSALLNPNKANPGLNTQLSRGFASGNEDLYARLGVSKSASEKDIKRAYKKATLKHHPDKGGDASKFKEIQEAYDVSFSTFFHPYS